MILFFVSNLASGKRNPFAVTISKNLMKEIYIKLLYPIKKVFIIINTSLHLQKFFKRRIKMQKIMIIEDDPAIRNELTLLLENEGYLPLPLENFTNIVEQVLESSPHLILLDLGLPIQDGTTICANIRQKTKIPIIAVTSRNSAMDELLTLSLGSDDYITKPYNIPVLIARIKAVLRRSSDLQETDILTFHGLSLNLTKGTITANNHTEELTRNELKILSHLMSHAGEIVSRSDLMDTLWYSQIYIDDNTLSVNITRLRGKLQNLGLFDYIKTRRGMGYQL